MTSRWAQTSAATVVSVAAFAACSYACGGASGSSPASPSSLSATNIAGAYVLTITQSSVCKNLPSGFRARAYNITLTQAAQAFKDTGSTTGVTVNGTINGTALTGTLSASGTQGSGTLQINGTVHATLVGATMSGTLDGQFTYSGAGQSSLNCSAFDHQIAFVSGTAFGFTTPLSGTIAPSRGCQFPFYGQPDNNSCVLYGPYTSAFGGPVIATLTWSDRATNLEIGLIRSDGTFLEDVFGVFTCSNSTNLTFESAVPAGVSYYIGVNYYDSCTKPRPAVPYQVSIRKPQ